jgi:hypothetical protein
MENASGRCIDEEFMNFVMRFGNIIIQFHELLDMKIKSNPFNDLTPNGLDRLTPIEKSLLAINTAHHKGEKDHRDIQMARLEVLIRNLLVIKHSKPALFEQYKQKMKRPKAGDTFFGVRFEVAIAESLILASVLFESFDRPDFQISIGSNKVFIECASARFRGGHIGNAKRKILHQIHTKSNEPYALPQTALFVDVTNIFQNTLNTGHQLDSPQLQEIAAQGVADTQFGAVCLWIHLYHRPSSSFKYVFVRSDSETIDTNLASLLNKWSPLIGQGEAEISVPSEG